MERRVFFGPDLNNLNSSKFKIFTDLSGKKVSHNLQRNGEGSVSISL